ncbi:hypothetical protein O2K51_02955 [Apibacter raozihei]|uniref:hypothetical protein n=1 Tax=Apibacter raozihei TaxID=2500547 RepID=UPI000FE39558|nr:hypothetical protein [Apibacter raozihei]
MKRKIFITLILSLFLFNAHSQSKMETMIEERIAILDTVRSKETLVKVANEFERMSLIDKTDWLIPYYTAYSYINIASLSKPSEIEAYCNRAENYIALAEKLNPDASEIYALYAYLYGIKVNIDPMVLGAELGKKSADYVNLALKANPENPRPYLIRAFGIYYTPKAFGGGEERAIPVLKEALQKFSDFKPVNRIAPHWGENTAQELLNSCLNK